MNLWIRSQSKLGLYKIDNIHCDCGDIMSYIYSVPYKLGSYSPERALEILDEIQNILLPKYVIRIDKNTQEIANFLNVGRAYICTKNNGDVRNINNTFVYEMPKE